MNIRSILSKKITSIISDNNNFDNTIFADAENKINLLIDVIANWSNIHNIISNKSTLDFILISIFDSLSFSDLKSFKKNQDKTIYDIGSGGGFPALPLAIVYPGINFVLVEKDRKKCSFLRLAKARLNLNNIVVFNQRMETIALGATILTRAAFSPLGIRVILPLMPLGGRLVIWATLKNQDEFIRTMTQYHLLLIEHHFYTLPEGQERVLLVLGKNGST